MISLGVPSVFVRAQEIVDLVKSFGRNDPITASGLPLSYRLNHSRFVVVDDIALAGGKDWRVVIENYIRDLYNERRVFAVTSGHPLDVLSGRVGSGFDSPYSPGFVGIIREGTKQVNVPQSIYFRFGEE